MGFVVGGEMRGRDYAGKEKREFRERREGSERKEGIALGRGKL